MRQTFKLKLKYYARYLCQRGEWGGVGEGVSPYLQSSTHYSQRMLSGEDTKVIENESEA